MIADASSLIIAAKISKLEILDKLYKIIYITEEIYNEIDEGSFLNAPDAKIIQKAKEDNKIKIIPLNKEYSELSQKLREIYGLDFGEADVIALALQEKKKEVIMDEKLGRQICKIYDIKPIGILGIFLEAYKKEVFNEKELDNIIKELLNNKFRIGADVINEFWDLAEEIKQARKLK